MIEGISLANQNVDVVKRASSTNGVELSEQFKYILDSTISEIAGQETTTSQLATQLMTGDLTDIHNLMIQNEKAAIGLELTVQVRNKVIEAYQEIMRMQI